MESRDKSFLTREILVGFHKQFAENQRSREQSFLRILAFLALPIVGYAYAYQYHFHPTKDFTIEIRELCYVQTLACLLLYAGTWTIVIIANNFRRDQFVNARIREMAEVLGDDKVFPTNYDPKCSFKTKALFKWMPDFLFVFYFLFIAVQAILLYVFINAVNPTLTTLQGNVDWTMTLTMGLTWFLLLVSLVPLPYYYRREVIKVMKAPNAEYSIWKAYKRGFCSLFHAQNTVANGSSNDTHVV